jgi:hypothetical protein
VCLFTLVFLTPVTFLLWTVFGNLTCVLVALIVDRIIRRFAQPGR